MSSKRRAYPQPLYTNGPGSQLGTPPVAGGFQQPNYGVDQLNQQFQGMNVDPNQAAVAGAPQAAAGSPYGYNQYQQPGANANAAVGGTGAAIGNTNSNNNNINPGANSPYDAYSQTQQHQSRAGNAAGASSYYLQQGNINAALPLNQLYTTDLSRELPPPISDLSLPPPPIVLPAGTTLIPNSETANAQPEYFLSLIHI